MPSINLQVASSLDDSHEKASDGSVSPTSTAVIHRSNSSALYRYTGAHRWASTHLPPRYSIITSAYVQLNVPNTAVDWVNVNLHFEKAASPAQFSANKYDISGRSLTAASVSWIVDGIGDGWQSTPSLVSILQEIVDNYSPTALVLIAKPNEDRNSELQGWSYDEDPDLAAKLHIEWRELLTTESAIPVCQENGEFIYI